MRVARARGAVLVFHARNTRQLFNDKTFSGRLFYLLSRVAGMLRQVIQRLGYCRLVGLIDDATHVRICTHTPQQGDRFRRTKSQIEAWNTILSRSISKPRTARSNRLIEPILNRFSRHNRTVVGAQKCRNLGHVFPSKPRRSRLLSVLGIVRIRPPILINRGLIIGHGMRTHLRDSQHSDTSCQSPRQPPGHPIRQLVANVP